MRNYISVMCLKQLSRIVIVSVLTGNLVNLILNYVCSGCGFFKVSVQYFTFKGRFPDNKVAAERNGVG